jgi:hypothetical protein
VGSFVLNICLETESESKTNLGWRRAARQLASMASKSAERDRSVGDSPTLLLCCYKGV